MQAMAELPKAFSVRDENEFLPIQHLLARLNPKLTIAKVATGRHVNGGADVFWGLVSLEGQIPTRIEVESALREAGFDFAHSLFDWRVSLYGDQEGRATKPGERSAKWMERVLPPWLRAA